MVIMVIRKITNRFYRLVLIQRELPGGARRPGYVTLKSRNPGRNQGYIIRASAFTDVNCLELLAQKTVIVTKSRTVKKNVSFQ